MSTVHQAGRHVPTKAVFGLLNPDAIIKKQMIVTDLMRSMHVHLQAIAKRPYLAQFPDPHWKMRNRKKRIVQPQLVEGVAKLLAAGGQVFLQSDVQEVRPHLSNAQT